MFGAVAAGGGAPGTGAAQEAPSLTVTTVDAAAYPQITAVVAAADANGVPVSGLTAEDFQAFEGETPLAVSGLQTQRLPLAIAVVIDVSGSMEGEPLAAAKQAANEFVQNLAPEDTASILSFSTEVQQVTPFTADKAVLTSAIDGLQAAGDTSLFDATQAAIVAVGQTPAPRKAVVLLSDGIDTTSTATAEQSLAVARDAAIPVYSIGFGPGPDTTYLQALAQETNGAYRAADVDSVSAVYAELSEKLNNVYTLTLMSPNSDAPGGPSSLRIIASIGGVPAEGTSAFDRPGEIAPAPTPVATPGAGSAVDDPAEGESNSATLLLAVGGGIAGLAALLLLAFVAMRLFGRMRTRRRQLAVVAPNLEAAAAQPLPQAPGAVVAEVDHGRGRIVTVDADGASGDGASFEFGSTPLQIGSARDCQVRVAPGPEVAPKHASVWMRDGKIMLRHTGGTHRPTLVAGFPVDWVILEAGDEFAVGAHRYRVEAVV
jgi:VWFA-related protein